MMPDRSDPCEYCGELVNASERLVTVYRHRKGKHFIFERVPARVCTACGERYFSAVTVREMDRQMKKGKPGQATVPVPVISLRAAS
jgi:YgiT-type zinc finger domain-containing protein